MRGSVVQSEPDGLEPYCDASPSNLEQPGIVFYDLV